MSFYDVNVHVFYNVTYIKKISGLNFALVYYYISSLRKFANYVLKTALSRILKSIFLNFFFHKLISNPFFNVKNNSFLFVRNWHASNEVFVLKAQF